MSIKDQLPNCVQDSRLGSCFEFEITHSDGDGIAVKTRVRVPVEPIIKAAAAAALTGRHSREDSVVVGRVVQQSVEADVTLGHRAELTIEQIEDDFRTDVEVITGERSDGG